MQLIYPAHKANQLVMDVKDGAELIYAPLPLPLRSSRLKADCRSRAEGFVGFALSFALLSALRMIGWSYQFRGQLRHCVAVGWSLWSFEEMSLLWREGLRERGQRGHLQEGWLLLGQKVDRGEQR